MKRHKTRYPGVFFRIGQRVGGPGAEKIFYVVYKKNGKLHEEKAGRQFADDMTPSRAAAIRSGLIEGKRATRKEKREQDLAEKQVKKWTVDRLYDEYKAQNSYLKGWRTYNSCYRKWIEPDFGKKEPHNLIPLDVDRLRIRMQKKVKPQTVKHALSLLRRIINFGERKRLCKGFSFNIEMPRVDNLKTEDLSADQLNNLLRAIEADDHPQAGPLMLMALYTGMRRGEMFRLKWGHINSESGFITLVDPKGGPDQKIPLNDAARDLLKHHPKKSQFVFPGRGGRQRTEISRFTRKIARAAGLADDFRPLHGLRHVYASMLASSGKVELFTIQKLLTHTDPKMTQRYAHLRDDALKRASELAGDIITQAINGDK